MGFMGWHVKRRHSEVAPGQPLEPTESERPGESETVPDTPSGHPIESPLGLSDVPTEEDGLGISSYIKGLTKFIRQCSTPMTIAIRGSWGTGKTSIMKQVDRELSKKAAAPVKTVWFNTWQYSQADMDDDLAVSFLTTLVGNIGLADDDRRQLNAMIHGTFGTAMKELAVYGSVLAAQRVGDAFSELIRNRMETLLGIDYANPRDGEEDYASSVERLKGMFQRAIDESLGLANDDEGETEERVVVFIDDLDRLEPKRAIELLEVLKNFLDCRHCVFVLAVDYEVIVNGVRAKYGNDIDEDKGRNFFDKIIQLEFRVPTEFYDVDEFIRRSLVMLDLVDETEPTGSGGDGPAQDKKGPTGTCLDLVKRSVGTNPRSMTRLFNAYKLLSIVMDDIVKHDAGHGNGTVAPADRNVLLFAIVCLQTSYREFYKSLTDPAIPETDVLDHVEHLLGLDAGDPGHGGEPDDEGADLEVGEDFLETLRDLLKELDETYGNGVADGGEGHEHPGREAFAYLLKHSKMTFSPEDRLSPEERAFRKVQDANYDILDTALKSLAGRHPGMFRRATPIRTRLATTKERGGVQIGAVSSVDGGVEYEFGLTRTGEGDEVLLRIQIKYRGDDPESFARRFKDVAAAHGGRDYASPDTRRNPPYFLMFERDLGVQGDPQTTSNVIDVIERYLDELESSNPTPKGA